MLDCLVVLKVAHLGQDLSQGAGGSAWCIHLVMVVRFKNFDIPLINKLRSHLFNKATYPAGRGE